MFDKIRNNDLINKSHLEDILHKFSKKQEVQTKRNYVILIIILSILVLGAVGFAVYKFFFAPIDDYDDYDDDYDDIEFEDDFEEDEDLEEDDEAELE